MKRLKSFLKNLEISLEQIKLNLNKDKITSVNLYFQDERDQVKKLWGNIKIRIFEFPNQI